MLVGGIGVFVGRGVAVGVLVGGTGVLVGRGVAVGVLVGTGVLVGATAVFVGRGVAVGVLVGTGVLVGVAVGTGVLVGVGVGVLVGVAVGVSVGGTGVFVGEEPPPPPPPLLVGVAAPVVAKGPYEIGGIMLLEASWDLVTVLNISPIAGPIARTDITTTTATRAIKRLYSSKLCPSTARAVPLAVLILLILYLVLAIINFPIIRFNELNLMTPWKTTDKPNWKDKITNFFLLTKIV